MSDQEYQEVKDGEEVSQDLFSDSLEARALARNKLMHFIRQRLLAGPGGSALFHILFLIIIINVAVGTTVDKNVNIQVQMIQPETVQQPEEKVEPLKEEVIEQTDPTEVITENSDQVSDNVMVIGDPTITDPGKGSGGSDADSAGIGSGLGMDAGFEISVVNSPLIIRGLYTSRTAGGKQDGMDRFGGGKQTEGSVMRALRWLKKNQEENGTWGGRSGGGNGPDGIETGMTGLALLTYLAHGDTPSSPEFGSTVEKAIKALMEIQKSGEGWPKPYQHPIATYAMCEAYSMTKIPGLKEAAKKGLDIIVAGQNATGGFDYQLNSTLRDDTSVMGWCVQAMKAGKIAGIDNQNLEAAMKKTIEGFKKNYQGDSTLGGFGYTEPGKTGLTGVGVLCNQLLGLAKSQEVKGGLATLQLGTFNWTGAKWNNVYWWYYDTQARFHEGGECWKNWNKQFSVPLVKAQTIIPKGIAIPSGKMVDIGYWDVANERGGRVMDTCLCALMLQVYYRYLPTFAKPEEAMANLVDAPKTEKVENKDLQIQIK